MHEDPDQVAALCRLVMNDKLSVTTKIERAKPFFANGVPPDRYFQITAHIKVLNNNPAWEATMSSVTAYYDASMAAETDPDERKRLALEMGEVIPAMVRLFNKFPGAPDKWEEGRRKIMDPRAKAEVIRLLEGRLNARFPGFLSGGRVSDAMKLETAAEQLGAEFTASPGLVAQRALQAGQIAEEEQRILEGAGVRVVDRVQNPDSGEWYYTTERIPRDESGRPILKNLLAARKVFVVRSRPEGRRIAQKAGIIGKLPEEMMQ